MSLRQINRERNSGESIFDKLFGFRKKSHFGKLKKKRGLSRPESLYKPKTKEDKEPVDRKKQIQIAAILIVAIAIISIEYYLWTSAQDAPEPEVIPENITVNQTPLVVNQTPEVKKPDLDIRSLELSTDEANIGDNITMTATIKNKGELNATNFTVEFFMGVLSLGSEVVENLEEGETIEVTSQWTVIEDALGRQNIRVSLDPDNDIDEEIETNNEDGETIDVSEKIYVDVSEDFRYMSVKNFNERWYSNKFQYPPKSGEDYTYFQIIKESGNTYYLDVAVSGIRTVKINNINRIEVQDASASGWNAYQCLKKSREDDRCIWNGPMFTFSITFDDGDMIITDASGTDEEISSANRRVDDIELELMQIADWPEEEIMTFRVTGAPQPDYLIPAQFYDVVDNRIYFYPVSWNPKSLNAKVALWARFKITTD